MPNQRLSCFRPTTTTTDPNPSTAHVSGNPTLTTTLYHTQFGLFALTWCRNLLGRSFHLHLLLDNYSSNSHSSSVPPSFQLVIKPFSIWKRRRGSKKLLLVNDDNPCLPSSKVVHLFWDLSRVKFGSRPEPLSNYYLAVVMDGVVALLVGDSNLIIRSFKSAIAKDGVLMPPSSSPTSEDENQQVMFLKREHVHGCDKSFLLYTTKAVYGGKVIDVSVDCRLSGDGDGDGDGDDYPKLSFGIDNQKVLQVKHLKWKFRGNDQFEIDGGVLVQVSWDVHRWLFQNHHDASGDGHALFMFRFQKLGMEDESLSDDYSNNNHNNHNNNSERHNGMWLWSQSQQTHEFPVGFESTKRIKKSSLRSGRSSSSSSLSSASSSCSSSVMEWASAVENELKRPAGFSLVIHAWKN